MKPLCSYPWYQVYLMHGGFYGPCCQIKYGEGGIFPDTPEALRSLFNSRETVELRRRLAAHDVKGLLCEWCLDNNVQDNATFIPQPETVSPVLNRIWGRAVAAFEAGETELDYFPLDLSISHSQTCNLKCTMCIQAQNLVSPSVFNLYPVERLKKLILQLGWEQIAYFGFSGGEVLFAKDGIELMKFVSECKPKDTRIGIYTNGVLIKNWRDELGKIPRAWWDISIDGYGEAYEKIRKGATWNELYQSILVFKEMKQSHPLWDFKLQSIVMKTSLPTLPELLDFFGDTFGNEVNIKMMRIYGEYYQENIFIYPSLLSGTDWYNQITLAIGKADKRKMTRVHNDLSCFREELVTLHKSPHPAIITGELKRLYSLSLHREAGSRWKWNGRSISTGPSAGDMELYMRQFDELYLGKQGFIKEVMPILINNPQLGWKISQLLRSSGATRFTMIAEALEGFLTELCVNPE